MELKIPATLEQVQLGAIAAANIAAVYYRIVTGNDPGKDNVFIDAVELAVGESCTNSVKHCTTMHPEESRITVCFELYDNQLRVMIKDCNAPFDFEKVLPPDFEKAPESGYGLYIMKQTMDEVHYLHKDGQNILTLKKSIVPGE
ncbi:MAG: ATP-binding protein [Desulfotalea sp.]